MEDKNPLKNAVCHEDWQGNSLLVVILLECTVWIDLGFKKKKKSRQSKILWWQEANVMRWRSMILKDITKWTFMMAKDMIEQRSVIDVRLQRSMIETWGCKDIEQRSVIETWGSKDMIEQRSVIETWGSKDLW